MAQYGNGRSLAAVKKLAERQGYGNWQERGFT